MAAPAVRACRGVRTICPLFTLASRGSPGRSPSFRRIGPGRTTCPLLEMRVCTVRRSYLCEGGLHSRLPSAALTGFRIPSRLLCAAREEFVAERPCPSSRPLRKIDCPGVFRCWLQLPLNQCSEVVHVQAAFRPPCENVFRDFRHAPIIAESARALKTPAPQSPTPSTLSTPRSSTPQSPPHRSPSAPA